MRVKWISISGFRSFLRTESPIKLDSINVLIGANNSGKSSIIRALHLMQSGAGNAAPDVRVGGSNAKIEISLDHAEQFQGVGGRSQTGGVLSIDIATSDRKNQTVGMVIRLSDGDSVATTQLPDTEPGVFIIPHLSKRKTNGYNEDVRIQYATQVFPSMQYLAARLSRIANPGFPSFQKYSDACKSVLGFMVTAIPSDNGQRPGIYIQGSQSLPIDQMGEGVSNIVSLLADLSHYEGKLFLIEEPENDLHPRALKALLDFIVESSDKNQFVISTHSNIVVRHLGAASNCSVYKISQIPDRVPFEVRADLLDSSAQSRLEALKELGYAFSDFDLWDGWLILEEASAERIIRDYLIPFFAPRLSRVRTLSVGGVSQIEPTFDDFNRLVRFTHLEKAYEGMVWVRVDGDASGKDLVARLRTQYPSKDGDCFGFFSEENFEMYYPSVFQEKASNALAISDKKLKREAKKELLLEVLEWLDEDLSRAKSELAITAKPVVDELVMIQLKLMQPRA